MTSFFIFTVLKTMVGLLFWAYGWRIFRLFVAVVAAAEVAAAVGLVAFVASGYEARGLSLDALLLRGTGIASLVALVAFFITVVLAWRWQRVTAAASVTGLIWLVSAVIWVSERREAAAMGGALAGVFAGIIVYWAYDIFAVLATAWVAAALLAPRIDVPGIDLGLARENQGRAMAEWVLRWTVDQFEGVVRHGFVGVWVAGWALALRFILWRKDESAGALKGDSAFRLPPDWQRAFAATAVLTVGDTVLSGLFGLSTTIGTVAIASPLVAIAIHTLHTRTQSNPSMYLRHVLAWILIVPFMSSLVLLMTAHSEAAIRHITEFYAEFRSHGSYTGLAPTSLVGLSALAMGLAGKLLGNLGFVPSVLAGFRQGSQVIGVSSGPPGAEVSNRNSRVGLILAGLTLFGVACVAILVISSGRHRTDTDRGLSVSELGGLANQAANVPPYVPGTLLGNKLMPDGFQDIAIGDSRDDVLRRHPGTISSSTAVVPLDGKGFTRVTLAFAGDGNGPLEMVVFNRSVPFSEAPAVVQATIDDDVTRYHRLPESIDERLRLAGASVPGPGFQVPSDACNHSESSNVSRFYFSNLHQVTIACQTRDPNHVTILTTIAPMTNEHDLVFVRRAMGERTVSGAPRRDRWQTDGTGGWFERVGGNRWVEHQPSSILVNFTEREQTADYVELFDPNRNMQFRLYASGAQWRVRGGLWNQWDHTGHWVR